MDQAVTGEGRTIDILEIMACLPHRYPFLLVDRIIEARDDVSCIGIKNVSMNEPQFQGHFPGQPVMPGVLLIEGMAQTAGAFCIHARKKEGASAPLVYFMTIDKTKFRKPVVPGDRVEFHVERTAQRRNIWWFRARALVEGQCVCESEFSAVLTDKVL